MVHIQVDNVHAVKCNRVMLVGYYHSVSITPLAALMQAMLQGQPSCSCRQSDIICMMPKGSHTSEFAGNAAIPGLCGAGKHDTAAAAAAADSIESLGCHQSPRWKVKTGRMRGSSGALGCTVGSLQAGLRWSWGKD